MAGAAVTKNLRDATIVFKDGSAPPNMIALVCEEGDTTWRESHAIVNVLDRGSLSHLRAGDEAPIEGSMTLKFKQFIMQTSDSTPEPYEVLRGIGGAASWISTNPDGGDVVAFDMDVFIASPTSGEENDYIAFTKVVATEVTFTEGAEYDTLAFNFTAFETAPVIIKTACDTSCQIACQTGIQT